jgi:predicted CoA-binding protein
MADWRENLIEDDARIGALVKGASRVAVLGIKPESKADQPAFYVAEFVGAHGAEVIPVPVFFPELTEILGKRVYRKVADVPGPVDIVDVFRKPSDIDAHVDDIIAK